MPAPDRAGSLTLPDGRRLSWQEQGEPSGIPVFALHGILGSHRQFRLAAAAAGELHVRLIAVDRPGYGGSSAHPDRRLTDVAADLAALAAHLRIARAGAVGISAGGPNALAAARGLPELIVAVSVLSCVGPEQRPRTEPRLLPSARAAFTAARSAPLVNRAVLAPFLALGRRRPATAVAIRSRGLPPVDRAVLARPAVHEVYEDEARHASRHAGAASAHDLAVLADGWGFDPGGITVPVHLWHGSEDHEAPIDQAEALARAIPGSVLHRHQGGGHLQFVDTIGPALDAVARCLRPAGRW